MSSIVVVAASASRNRFLGAVLQTAGHAVFQAVDRASALRLLAQHEISVIISDIHLADGNWQDFLSDVAPMAEPPRLLVIAPAADDVFWAEVLHLGGYDVLLEPLNAEEITRVIEAATESWRPVRPLAKAAGAVSTAFSQDDRGFWRSA